MASGSETVDDFQEFASLVKASFPDLACLRCGNPDFYLETELSNWDESSTMAKVPEPEGAATLPQFDLYPLWSRGTACPLRFGARREARSLDRRHASFER